MGSKRQEREADHSTPLAAELKYDKARHKSSRRAAADGSVNSALADIACT
jgi:hypothetical protein